MSRRLACSVVLFLIAVVCPAASAQDFQLNGLADDLPIQFSGEFRLVEQTRTGRLQVSATIADRWHVYSVTQPDGGPTRTVISVAPNPGLSIEGPFKPDRPPEVDYDDSVFKVTVEEHQQAVVWSAPIRLADGVDPASLTISISVTGLVCKGQEMCLPFTKQLKAKFGGFILADSLGQTKSLGATDRIGTATQKADAGIWKSYPIASVLLLAFLAGLILNVMPCVLPVIGIKLMSFVQQSGSSRTRLVMLNLVFSAGIVSVFMILASLAVFFGYGWGDLYKQPTFTMVMVSVVFVFALSFVGVWEIPIPGFVGNVGGKVSQQEGFAGAFIKGVLTTLLATPCSGPLVVPAVVWAIAQPVGVSYLVFAAMGLGMAAPYLLLGFVPGLSGLLPRPGQWMVTFKVVMGFVLLGAVVFFLGSVPEKYRQHVMLVRFSGLCLLASRSNAADR